MWNEIKRLGTSAALVILTAGAAYGQSTTAGAPAAGGRATLADAAAHARFDADSPQAQDPDDPYEKGTWDDIKRGFYAGLVVGGLVGVVMVAECGHPECGPLLTLAAGVGGAIGLGIDALFERSDDSHRLAGGSAHAGARRPAPAAGPRVMVRLRKSW